jgi:hypothetical protein
LCVGDGLYQIQTIESSTVVPGASASDSDRLNGMAAGRETLRYWSNQNSRALYLRGSMINYVRQRAFRTPKHKAVAWIADSKSLHDRAGCSPVSRAHTQRHQIAVPLAKQESSLRGLSAGTSPAQDRSIACWRMNRMRQTYLQMRMCSARTWQGLTCGGARGFYASHCPSLRPCTAV